MTTFTVRITVEDEPGAEPVNPAIEIADLLSNANSDQCCQWEIVDDATNGIMEAIPTEPAMTKSKQINIRLTPEQETLLRQYCVRNGLNTQEAVVAALARVFAPGDQQTVPPGYMLTPSNATKEMLRAGLEKLNLALTVGMPEFSMEDGLDMAYDAMLEAAKRNDGGNDD